jgi:hypothetical protein
MLSKHSQAPDNLREVGALLETDALSERKRTYEYVDNELPSRIIPTPHPDPATTL